MHCKPQPRGDLFTPAEPLRDTHCKEIDAVDWFFYQNDAAARFSAEASQLSPTPVLGQSSMVSTGL